MKAAAITLTLFPLAGLAILTLLRRSRPLSLAGTAGMVFLFGAGATGLAMFLATLAGVPPGTAALVIGATSVLTIVYRRRRLVTVGAARREPALWAATILTVLPYVLLLFVASILPLTDYDGLVTWMPKALAIVSDHSIVGPFFHGARGLNLHNQYPLLVPLDIATIMLLSGDHTDHASRWFYVLLPLSYLFYSRELLARRFSRSASAWLTAGLAWLPMIAVAPEGGALSAYSDIAIAAFTGAAVLSLIAEEPPLLCAGWLAFLVLSKNEGAVIGGSIIAALIFLRPSVRVTASLVLSYLGAMVALQTWRAQIPAAYDEQYGALLRHLPERLHRWPEAVTALSGHAGMLPRWGGFWLAVSVASVVVIGRVRSREGLFLVAILLLVLGTYVVSFTITSWQVDALAAVVADRLLLQLIGPASGILLVALQRGTSASEGNSMRPSPRPLATPP